jgi:hypothetical protein
VRPAGGRRRRAWRDGRVAVRRLGPRAPAPEAEPVTPSGSFTESSQLRPDLPRLVKAEAELALRVAHVGSATTGAMWTPPAWTPPQGFASLLDFTGVAEEHRLRVRWSGSDGSDGFDEDR